MLIFPRRISQLPWSPHFLITLCTWSRPRGVVACRRAKLSALARPGVRVGPTVGYIVIWGFQTARRLSSPGGCRNVTGTLQQLIIYHCLPFSTCTIAAPHTANKRPGVKVIPRKFSGGRCQEMKAFPGPVAPRLAALRISSRASMETPCMAMPLPPRPREFAPGPGVFV